MSAELAPLQSAWRELTAEPGRQRLPETPALEVHGAARALGSPFALDDTAVAAVAAALLSAADLAEARGGARPAVSVERAHAALAFASERCLRTDRALAPAFAPLSRFAETADGHIRLHANYPHHRTALLRALGAPANEQLALEAVRSRPSIELEQAILAAGGAAAAVRPSVDWMTHAQGRATAELGLLDLEPNETSAKPMPPGGELPCSGLRVLDLTRVIAGPVGTRMLAALGAEVLRLDPPQMPELELAVLDGAVGKRSALLDLRRQAGRAALERLLRDTDVLVHAYRPGALDAFGLDRAGLAVRHPHLVTVTLSAWGHLGPWASNRGFDSLVQAACGIAVACAEQGAPGALPVQALDHASGYLIAAAALRGLLLRAHEGRAAYARLALTRTASWIVSHLAPSPAPTTAVDPERYLVEVDSPSGGLLCLSPPGQLDGRALRWPRGVPTPGSSPPSW